MNLHGNARLSQGVNFRPSPGGQNSAGLDTRRSVAVRVRRGDYAQVLAFGFLSSDYRQRALLRLRGRG